MIRRSGLSCDSIGIYIEVHNRRSGKWTVRESGGSAATQPQVPETDDLPATAGEESCDSIRYILVPFNLYRLRIHGKECSAPNG